MWSILVNGYFEGDSNGFTGFNLEASPVNGWALKSVLSVSVVDYFTGFGITDGGRTFYVGCTFWDVISYTIVFVVVFTNVL